MAEARKDSPEKLAALVRALNLIPYVHQHPHATPMEIARDLGHSPAEVMDDLRRLQMSGVGSGPGELIDLAAEWTGVTVIDDQGLNTPLRLTPTEANALLLTLESLETMPGLVDQRAVNSAAQKLRDVMRAKGVPDAEQPQTSGPEAVVSQALSQRRMLELTYYSATSDTLRARAVSPMGLFHRDGNTYLSAFEDGDAKTFRLDRIKDAQLLDVPSTPAPKVTYDADDPFGFRQANIAELRIASEATWLADYWQIDLADTSGDDGEKPGGDEADEPGWVAATMPYGSDDWLIRFCLSQADRVRVVSPPHIAQAVAAAGSAGLERYA